MKAKNTESNPNLQGYREWSKTSWKIPDESVRPIVEKSLCHEAVRETLTTGKMGHPPDPPSNVETGIGEIEFANDATTRTSSYRLVRNAVRRQGRNKPQIEDGLMKVITPVNGGEGQA